MKEKQLTSRSLLRLFVSGKHLSFCKQTTLSVKICSCFEIEAKRCLKRMLDSNVNRTRNTRPRKIHMCSVKNAYSAPLCGGKYAKHFSSSHTVNCKTCLRLCLAK